MNTEASDTFSHSLFEAGAFLKGIHGLFEITGAVAMYVVSGTTITRLVSHALVGEVREDPNDYLANFLLQHTSHISLHGKDFAALYLFVSGIVNIVLVSGLLLHRKHFFPAALAVLAVFAGYQIYLFAQTLSPWLPFLTLYDCVLMYLVHAEYQRRWPTTESPGHAA